MNNKMYRGRYNGNNGKFACGAWIEVYENNSGAALKKVMRIAGLNSDEIELQAWNNRAQEWKEVRRIKD